MTQKTATYIGGPLDGQAATRTGTRWSIYRDDDGRPIQAARGDREFIHRVNAGLSRRRFYIRQTDVTTYVEVYIHATALEQWRAAQRGSSPTTTTAEESS